MTVQEAIKILRDTPIDIRSTREDDIHTLYATAQGMAIEALKYSEIPNSSDTISRQDAIRLAEQGQIQGFEWQFKKLCELPSAEPEVIRCYVIKTGRHFDEVDILLERMKAE